MTDTATNTATDTPTASSPDLTPGEWTVEPAHSEIAFSVRHLGLSKVRGRFNRFEGTVIVDTDPGLSSVEATVELGSVDTNNADRDNHLRSTDFLDVETKPTMAFRSSAVSATELSGDITINGVTRSITFDLEFHGVAVDLDQTTRAGFSASGSIRRSDFGVDFNAPLGADRLLIGDRVELALEIQIVPAGKS